MMKAWIVLSLIILIQLTCSHIIKNDSNKDIFTNEMVYLNLTIYQGSLNAQNGTYLMIMDLLPINNTDLLKLYRDSDEVLQDPQAQLQNMEPGNSTSSPGGINGAVETFLQSTQAFSEGVIETIGNFIGSVPKFLGINATQIRKDPLNTAVSSINNVAFCNPLFAGVNAGRCKGFFMAT